MNRLMLAKKKFKNPVWAAIYNLLKKCTINMVNNYPNEFLGLSATGKPDIANNFSSIKHDWCKNLQLHQILDCDFELKKAALMP